MFIPEPAKLVHKLTGEEVGFEYIEYSTKILPYFLLAAPHKHCVFLQQLDPTMNEHPKHQFHPILSVRDPKDGFDSHVMIGRPLIAQRNDLKSYIYTVHACKIAAQATERDEGELRYKVLKACNLLRTDVEHTAALLAVNRPPGFPPADARVLRIAKELL